MAKNGNLHGAKRAKNDEFYTQLTDIEKELRHYKKHFEDKIVFCNCDDPEHSNFWQYFSLNFDELKLKKLIATHYDREKPSYMLEMWRDDSGVHSGIKTLKQNGDFRSEESIELLKEADIVCTNPPFSLFREYVAQLMEHEKKFLIIGNKNAITYKEFFPLLKENRVWIGYNNVKEFKQPDGTIKKFGNIGWFTNLDIDKRHEELVLFRRYYDDPTQYPKYDNYDAINVDKVSDIPIDYVPCWFNCKVADQCPFAKTEGLKNEHGLCELKSGGVMGVPITFLDKHNPRQFKIIGLDRYIENNPHYGHRFKLNGKETYARILLQKV